MSSGELRFVGSELRLVFGRRRNQMLLLALAAIPVVIGLAIRFAAHPHGDGGGGPAFIGQVAGNGLVLAFAALIVVLPFFLPLAVSVVAGDAIAGEANTGTLRYLLVVPVARGRLIVVKYVGILAFALVAALLVAAAAVVIGVLLFPVGPVTLLSGTEVSFAAALWRVLLVACYVGAMLAGVGAIGLFISTLTEVPIAAMAATAVVPIAAQILGQIPQIAWLHPWLPTRWWFAFGDLLRAPIATGDITRGLLSQLGYVVVVGLLAWARLTTKDVSS